MKKIKQILNNKRLVRYFIMAVAIVLIELITFQAVYLLTNNYYAATIISFTVGVILNWIIGRLLVFGASQHDPWREFYIVLGASLIGVTIQILVVYVSVNVFGILPILGKVLSIAFSFFWNYWFRAHIIYANK